MKSLLFLFPLLFNVSVFAAGWELSSKSGQGSVEFEASASPGNLKIVGKILKAKAKSFQWLLKNKDGKLHAAGKIDLRAWDTGIELRNNHLRDNYLHTEKYPHAILKLAPVVLGGDRELASSVTPFSGDLTLHGQTKKINGQLSIAKNDEGKIEYIFKFPVLLSDFEIPLPGFMGVGVANEVEVTARFLR